MRTQHDRLTRRTPDAFGYSAADLRSAYAYDGSGPYLYTPDGTGPFSYRDDGSGPYLVASETDRAWAPRGRPPARNRARRARRVVASSAVALVIMAGSIGAISTTPAQHHPTVAEVSRSLPAADR